MSEKKRGEINPGVACDVSNCKAGSMCHMILALEGAPGGKRTQVVLINEDLGY